MSLELLAFGIHVFSVTWVRTTITNSCKDQKSEWHDCESKKRVSVHCSLCEIVVRLIVPSELYRFKRRSSSSVPCETIKNLQKFMASLSTLEFFDCVLNVHGFVSFVRVRVNQKVVGTQRMKHWTSPDSMSSRIWRRSFPVSANWCRTWMKKSLRVWIIWVC